MFLFILLIVPCAILMASADETEKQLAIERMLHADSIIDLGEMIAKTAQFKKLESNIAGLKSNIAGLKSNVVALETADGGLKSEIAAMKRDLIHCVTGGAHWYQHDTKDKRITFSPAFKSTPVFVLALRGFEGAKTAWINYRKVGPSGIVLNKSSFNPNAHVAAYVIACGH